MTYDPFQAYSAFGAHPGLTSPFASPFNALQAPINPLAALNPMSGIHPQQLQLAQILAARAAAQQFFGVSPYTSQLQNPFTSGLQNSPGIPGLENPLANPLINPLAQFQIPQQIYGLNAPVGQFGMQGGQGGLPYPQQFQPYPQQLQGLAPQSWVGQPGIHPLLAQQLAGRGLHSPWTGF